MKRKYGFIFMLLAVTLLLSGCTMKMNMGLNISKDGKVTAKTISAIDNEMIDAMMSMNSMGEEETEEQPEITDEQRWAFVEGQASEDNEQYKDYKKEKYDKDGLKGYVYTKELGSIDDLVAENADAVDMNDLDADSKMFVKKGDKYVLNVKSDTSYKEQSAQYSESGATFDVKFEVTLPNKASKSNATSVKGTTYTWDLLKADSIELEFDLKGGSCNWLLIGGIAGGVLVVCVVLCLVLKKKKQ